MKYRKKSVIIEAIEWNGMEYTYDKIKDPAFNKLKREVYPMTRDGKLRINTLEGIHEARMGDYIIQGVNGEIYPCKPDIFEKTYEPVND